MMRYINKLFFTLYYLLFLKKYKYLDFKTGVYFSVRVQGKKYITLLGGTIVQRYGWLLALKIDENDPVLHIGKRCAIGDSCHIASVRKVVIEDDVLIANKVYISDNVHSFEDINTPIIRQAVVFKKEVVIGKGSWIGENVCIIGVNIGKNCVVGANSVVTKDVPDYCVVVGIPARIIKRFDLVENKWINVK